MITSKELRALVNSSEVTLDYWTKKIEEKAIAHATLGNLFFVFDAVNGFNDPKFAVNQKSWDSPYLSPWQKLLATKLGSGLQLKIGTYDYTIRNDDDPEASRKLHKGYHLELHW